MAGRVFITAMNLDLSTSGNGIDADGQAVLRANGEECCGQGHPGAGRLRLRRRVPSREAVGDAKLPRLVAAQIGPPQNMYRDLARNGMPNM